MLSSRHDQMKANLSATKVPAQKGDTEASKRKAMPTTKLPNVRMKGIELIHKKYHQGPKMHLILDTTVLKYPPEIKKY